MKHRGRVGPAALVGVGASVIPVDVDDRDRTSVAVVTSGTGEHMATTMAGRLFAERLYTGTRRARGGVFEEADNDDDVIRCAIEREFMGTSDALALFNLCSILTIRSGHSSVRANPSSAAAIGLLAVKKTKEGVYLHFAHNTDSFVSSRAPVAIIDCAVRTDHAHRQWHLSMPTKSSRCAQCREAQAEGRSRKVVGLYVRGRGGRYDVALP